MQMPTLAEGTQDQVPQPVGTLTRSTPVHIRGHLGLQEQVWVPALALPGQLTSLL